MAEDDDARRRDTDSGAVVHGGNGSIECLLLVVGCK